MYIGCLLNDLVDDRDQKDPLQYPLLGAQLILNTKSASRQLPHVDFQNNPDLQVNNSMWGPSRKCSYFAMISGCTSFPIWVWDCGHYHWNAPEEISTQIFKTMRPVLVTVPPRSILLVREDLPHAGAGGKDSPSTEADVPRARLHMYITGRESAEFGDRVADEDVDSIHLLPRDTFCFPSDDDKSADNSIEKQINENGQEHPGPSHVESNRALNETKDISQPNDFTKLTHGDASFRKDLHRELVELDESAQDGNSENSNGKELKDMYGDNPDNVESAGSLVNQTGPC